MTVVTRAVAACIGTLAVLLSACSAMISTIELQGSEKSFDGVPFRVRERFVVEVFQKTENGYVKVAEDIRSLPNPNRVYLLRHNGQALADTDSKLSFRDDSTLSEVTMNAASKGPELASGLGEQVGALGKQMAELKLAKTTATQNVEAALQSSEKSGLNYLDAYNAALLSDQQLSELRADETPSVVLGKRNEVRAAKLKANVMARRAGLPRPFPDFTL